MEKTITVNITEKITCLGLDWDESVLIQFTLPDELSVEEFLDNLQAKLNEVKNIRMVNISILTQKVWLFWLSTV